MAQDATGTPTALWGIPKYNTSVDPPSGKGFNAAMDVIDGIIIPDLLLDAKGDLIVATAADTAARLAVGTDGQVLTADSAQAAGVAWSGAGAAGVPSGSITAYGGASAPTDWLLCDGAAVSRSTFADLFTAISTAYGAGDGSTTFNVPDLRGRTPFGKGTNAAINTLGFNEGVSEANRRPQHRHSPHGHDMKFGTGAGGGQAFSAPNSFVSESQLAGKVVAIDGGSGNANDSLDASPYQVVNFIIKT